MGTAARKPLPLRFALVGQGRQVPFLEVDREDGLDLLEWLGLGRAEFGAIEASTLGPLCRRRLWPEPRNARPFVSAAASGGHARARMRETATLARLASRVVSALKEAAGAVVHFG